MPTLTDDHAEILRVMELYIDGFNDNDIGKFKEAFHEDAWIFYVDAYWYLPHLTDIGTFSTLL